MKTSNVLVLKNKFLFVENSYTDCFEKEAHNDVCKQGDGVLGMANNFSQEKNGLKYFIKGNSHFSEQ